MFSLRKKKQISLITSPSPARQPLFSRRRLIGGISRCRGGLLRCGLPRRSHSIDGTTISNASAVLGEIRFKEVLWGKVAWKFWKKHVFLYLSSYCIIVCLIWLLFLVYYTWVHAFTVWPPSTQLYNITSATVTTRIGRTRSSTSTTDSSMYTFNNRICRRHHPLHMFVFMLRIADVISTSFLELKFAIIFGDPTPRINGKLLPKTIVINLLKSPEWGFQPPTNNLNSPFQRD